MLLFFGATIICECSIRCLRWRTHSSSLVISDEHIKRRSRTDLGEVILFGSIPELMPPLHEALTLPKDEALAASLIICLNKYGQINVIRKTTLSAEDFRFLVLSLMCQVYSIRA